jgi:hypothetical protein
MIVAFCRERLAIEANFARAPAATDADARERNTGDGSGEALVWPRGEEQFVIFASVQGLLEGGSAEDGRRSDLGGNVGGETEAVEIGGKAVAYVHRGRCASAEVPAQGEAGFRAKMALPGGPAPGRKA